jgi:hypothetical protein
VHAYGERTSRGAVVVVLVLVDSVVLDVEVESVVLDVDVESAARASGPALPALAK